MHRLSLSMRDSIGPWDAAALGFLALILCLAVTTFRDYGVTWDEDQSSHYGFLVLDYYRSGFADTQALHWRDLFNYGAAFDLTAAIIEPFSPWGRYETRHLLNALVGIAGLLGTWRLGRHLGGARTGCLAVILLATIPNWYGQSFNNPKDIPFAAGMIWGLYWIQRMMSEWPRVQIASIVKFGIAAGLTLGVRVGGLLLFFYAGLACLAAGAATWHGSRPARSAVTTLAGVTRIILISLLIAYPLMLAFWPWAQADPPRHPLVALRTFSHENFPYTTLFAGHYYQAAAIPRLYLPTFVILALPELTLALLVAFPWLLFTSKSTIERIQLGLLGWAIVFPIAYAVAIHAVLFDGMRHFIFVLPPIAVAAALVADRVIARLAGRPERGPLAALVAVYAVGHLGIMVALHPDQYVYYNGLIGGVGGADGRFKIDYWANSYREAVRGLTSRLEAEYGDTFATHRFSVAVCGPPVSATYYFPPNFTFTEDRSKADFFIAFTMDDCNRALPGPVIYRVERLGVLLSAVIDRRSATAP